MNLSEAWKLSRYPYNEVAYRSIEMSRGSSSYGNTAGRDQKKRFDVTVKSARTSKVAFAVLGTIGAAFPFFEFIAAPSPEALVSGVSLSLAISLAYIVFFSLQILPSFSSGEAYQVLRTLPIGDRDFSLVAALSFFRTFDLIALTTSAVQVSLVLILTHSAVSTILMALGCGVNIIFAMAIALWFSGLFYKNATRGGRSKAATIARMLFLVTWGVAAMSIGFLFNFISYALPFFTSAILGSIEQPAGLVLSLLHPFSISVVITNIVYPQLYSTSPLPPLISFASTFGYFALSLYVGRHTLRSISNITRGGGIKVVRQAITDFSLSLKRPLAAYVMKDLRLASKNPSMAFFYATPLFEVITLAIVTVQFPVMRASAMIVATVVGCFFSIMICSTLLNTEGSGLEYTLSLPIRGRTIVSAKALIASLTYVPVPIALLLIGLSKHLTSEYSLFIPFVEALAIGSACTAEIAFFVKPRRLGPGGKTSTFGQLEGFSIMAGSDVKRLMQSFAISAVILLIPMLSYVISFLLSHSHIFGIVVMLNFAAIEFGIVLGIVQRIIR